VNAWPAGFDMAQANGEVWFGRGLAAEFRDLALRPAEWGLLERHRETLGGRVLELGSGAGRLTVHLGQLASELFAVDGSSEMVTLCRDRVPGARIEAGDLQDLSGFEPGSFDAVVAGFNMFDVVTHDERRELLRAVRGKLSPDGRLLFSSHNRGYEPRFGTAWHLLLGRPREPVASLLALRQRLANRRRMRALERHEADYAILNDPAHDFALLHYHITRDAQEAQLAACGYELLDCRDLDDRPVAAGAAAAHCPELHYVARAAVG